MSYKYLIAALFLISSICSYSQDFEKYKEQQSQRFEQLKEQRNDKLQELRQSYASYVQLRNEEFAKFVSESWKSFETIKGEEYSDTPKPSVIPSYKERQQQSEPQKLQSIGDITLSEPFQHLDVVRIPDNNASLAEPFLKNIDFNFYGEQITYKVDPKLYSFDIKEVTKTDILETLNIILQSNYDILLDQIFETKENNNLNDWGLFLLIEAVSNEIVHNQNYSRMLSWALLNLAGYDVKIGTSDDNCFLMIPAIQKMYRTYSLLINEENYYILDFVGTRISTYEHTFSGALKSFDFNLYKTVNFVSDNSHSMSLLNEKVKNDEIFLNKNLMGFYNDYPLVDPSVYFNAPMSINLKEHILKRISPSLENKTEVERLNYILEFVQNEFDYKSDREQFNREKFFFPDELFYYPFSDCEDRSVLFAYIVRWLLGNEVLGLQYDGHMATAVAIDMDIQGDYVVYNNVDYTICDPTFRNAPVGMGMPEYREKDYRTIKVENNYSKKEIENQYWHKLVSSGAIVTCKDNSAHDSKGNVFVAGSYKGELVLGNHKISAEPNCTNVFLACFDKKKELSWIKNIDFKNKNLLNGLIINQDNLFLNISSFNELDTTVTILSCCTFTTSGVKLWSNSWNVNTELFNENSVWSIKLNTDGSISQDEKLFSGEPVVNSNIYAYNDKIILNSNFKSTLGLRIEDIEINTYAESNILKTLQRVYQEFIENKYEPYTAAVMAVFDVLKNNGMSLSGKELAAMLEKSSPELIRVIPELFENLNKINNFTNENGLIILRTLKGKKIAFFKMYFSDKAAVKVIDLHDFNTKIECLKGVQVGNKVIKFPLNNISVDVKNGNFQLDYGSDNTKTVVNLKEDILNI